MYEVSLESRTITFFVFRMIFSLDFVKKLIFQVFFRSRKTFTIFNLFVDCYGHSEILLADCR